MQAPERILRRIARELGGGATLQSLEALAPRDLESLLLHLLARRSERRHEGELLSQFEGSPAVRPGLGSARALNRFEREAFEAAAAFEMIALPPVVPLGAARLLGGQHQNNVLSATRRLEVLADPTLALALLAAERRRAPHAREAPLQLGAHARVMRLQPLTVPGLLPHFMLFALSSAGRGTAGEFEHAALREHLSVHLDLLRRLGQCGFAFQAIEVELSDTRVVRALLERAGIGAATVRERVRAHRFGSAEALLDELGLSLPRGRHAEITTQAGLPKALDARLRRLDAEILAPLSRAFPEATFRLSLARLEGLGYYDGPCLRVSAATAAGARFPLSDGGCLDWMARLLGDRRERLVTSGLGPDLICSQFTAARSALEPGAP